MKRIVILYSEYSPVIDAIKYQLQKSEVVCIKEPDSTIEDCDLVVLVNYNSEFNGNALKCHHSLLPSFETDEPVKDAMMAGVKVTGITVFETESKKIITQYPVFIKEDMHYDELKQELNYLEQTIYPLVIEGVLNNEPFDIKELMNGNCGGNCGGCAGCKC